MKTFRQPAEKTLRESTTSQRFNTGFAQIMVAMIGTGAGFFCGDGDESLASD